MKVKVYSIKNYSGCTHKFIENNIEEISSTDLLIKNKNYHFRIFSSTQKKYIFFGDLDHFTQDIKIFVKDLKCFLSKNRIHFQEKDFKYTKNDYYFYKENSYHFSIPTLYSDIPTLKCLMKNFIQCDEYKKYEKFVDTNIYRNGWFRCPYQSKPLSSSGKHIIVEGEINDFIIDYSLRSPSNSFFININNIDNNIDNKIDNKKVILKKKIIFS